MGRQSKASSLEEPFMAMFQHLCILGALTDSADEVKVSEKASSITVQSCVVLKELQNVKVGGLYIR